MKLSRLLLPFLLALFIISCDDSDPNPWKDNNPETPEITTPIVYGLRDGINVISDDSLGFMLYAPGKRSVFLIGDFNNWQVSEEYRLTQEKDGRFWIKIGDLEKGKEYICQYLVDGHLRIADPYANKISDPWNDSDISNTIYPNLIKYPADKTTEIAMVVSTNQDDYNWTVQSYQTPNPEDMVIYEILIRDFTTDRSIKAVQAKLPYLKELGVNAIELMPFNEFEANNSWGYNPSFYFATDKAYGTSNDYKSFIDACHTNGMAVIMDMVLNHSYGQSPMVRLYMDGDKVSSDNPWYNVDSPNTDYSWGYDFNHESKATQAFVDSVCSFWMKEYKIDGFRFDFTKGFTNKVGNGWDIDESRINILKRMTNEIWKRKSDAIVIFEHLTDNSEEKVLSDHGIYLWGNINNNFNQATMGWDGNSLDWASYTNRGWSKPNLVAYMESHDEERIMFKNQKWGNSSNPDHDARNLNVALKRTEGAAVLLMTIPGPKMIWQFGEMGYDYELNDDRLAPKPPRWDYMDVAERKSLHDVYAKMIKLRNENPIFSTADFVVSNDDNLYKEVLLRSANGNVCAMANLNVTTTSKNVNFGKTGEWEEYFTGQKLNVTSTTQSVELNPGEYRLYISK